MQTLRALTLTGMLVLALALLLWLLFSYTAAPVQAQDQLGLTISKQLQGDAVVRIGELLTFEIVIANTGSVPLTRLVVVDEFERTIVAPAGSGPFAEPGDPPLSEPPGAFDGNNRIVWDNLVELAGLPGGELRPGQELRLLVRLRAIRPTAELQTVNRARIDVAIGSQGETGGGGSAEVPARPQGARLPLTKQALTNGPIVAGDLITFTITLTNDGAIDLVDLPLRDVYNPAVLRFVSADPPPPLADDVAGILEWPDLLATTGRGRLGPGEALQVTTVYEALLPFDGGVNSASVARARDEYANEYTERRAEAPIRILPAGGSPAPPTPPGTATPITPTAAPATPTAVPRAEPTATPTRLPTAGPLLTEVALRRTQTAAPTATAAPLETAAPTAAAGSAPTATLPAPATLPATSAAVGPRPVLLALLALLVLALGGLASRLHKR